MAADATTPSPAASRERILVTASIALFAVLLTLKYFPGLESEPAYAGLAYQAIHPDAFHGDPYRGPETSLLQRPLHLSLVYVFAKLAGDVWLDERFMAVLYVCLVAVGLAGIDRTARLFGISGIAERLIVLLMFVKDHAVLDHKVLLAHHQDVNHTAFAIPVIVWLFYAALARKGLPVVLALSVLLMAFSIRNAPIPIVTAMAVVAVTGRRWERHAVIGLAVAGAAFVNWVLFHVMTVPDAGRLELWDVLRRAAGGDVNPFDQAFSEFGAFVVVNLTWMAIIGAAFVLSPAADPAFCGVRVVMSMALLTWLIGGLYISFAPDFLKVPLLQGIAPTRALAWPQNLAYVTLIALTLRQFDGNPEPRRIALIGLAMAALFIVGPGNIGRWTALVAVALATVLVLHRVRVPGTATARTIGSQVTAYAGKHWRLVFAQTLAIAVAVSYTVAVWGKAPAWSTALQTGVFGDATPAAWIGVAEYIRTHTPPGASVLPITYRLVPSYPALPKGIRAGELRATRSLGTRAGRAMPVPQDFPTDFGNPQSWRHMADQKAVLARLLDALKRRDFAAAAAAVARLQPVPDYIVLPEDVFGPTAAAIGPYQLAHRIRGYALLQRQ